MYFYVLALALSCLGLGKPCVASRCVALPCVALPLRCLALRCLCVALRCVALPLRCLALHRVALRCLGKPCLALEAWHAYPCTQPARIMHEACAQHAGSLGMSCLGLAMPCLALHCIGISCLGLCTPCLAMPCLALACRGLGMSCLGLGIAPFKAFRESEAIGSLGWRGLPCLGIAPDSRHSEKVRLLEAWHVGSLRASCTKPARSMSAACAQRAQSVDRIFGNLGLSCLGKPCLALACRALAFARLVLPCHAAPCLALPWHAVALALPHSRHFEKVRLLEAWPALACRQPARIMHEACAQHVGSVRVVLNLSAEFFETLSCLGMSAACAQHAENVDLSFQTLSNPIFVQISPHNKLPIIKSMIFRAFSNLQNDF